MKKWSIQLIQLVLFTEQSDLDPEKAKLVVVRLFISDRTCQQVRNVTMILRFLRALRLSAAAAAGAGGRAADRAIKVGRTIMRGGID